MKRTMSSALAGLLALAWSEPAWGSPPELTVAPEGVSIAVPAGGRVAVVGVMHRLTGVIPGFERWEGIVADDDGDGRAEIVLERSAIPESSQWIAVDLASGAWATAGRSEAGESARPVPAGEELAAGSSLWPVPVGLVEVLVVRPGEGESAGAWSGEVWDGGSADGDGLADGVAGVAPGRLRPVGASGPAPERYEAGDVLIAITPRALRYGITRVVEVAEEVSR